PRPLSSFCPYTTLFRSRAHSSDVTPQNPRLTPGTPQTTPAPAVRTVGTDAGEARVTWHPAHGDARLVLALGHGAGGGSEARDLRDRKSTRLNSSHVKIS